MEIKHGRKIGSGGYGEVFEAAEVETGEDLAVKRLLRHLSKDVAVRRRFAREVRLQEGLRHPNVMPILGKSLEEDPPWYVMPRAETDLVVPGRQTAGSDDFIEEVFLAVLQGVQAAHNKGIIHRDIKPQNVLRLPDGRWVISDFGASRELDRTTTTITRSAEGIGTIDYMAPEQYSDPASTDRRGDIFGLGKLLLYLIRGEVREPFRPSRIPGGKWGPIVDRATQVDPAHRYQSVEEMLRSVQDVLAPPEYKHPNEVAEELRESLIVGEATDATMDEIVRFLSEHPDERYLHQRVVPYVQISLLVSLSERAEDSFRGLIERYDRHVSGGLEFSYCDVVADFYRALVAEFSDLWIFRLVMRRLLDLGWSHNRWHVQGVIVSIVRSNLGNERATIAREEILAQAEAASWAFEDYDLAGIPGPIADAIVRVSG